MQNAVRPSTASESTSKRPRRWLEISLIAGFLFSLLLGAGAFTAIYLLRTAPAERPTGDPLTAVDTQRIAPQLALAQLAGDPPAALAYQAVAAGHIDLAQAILTYDTTLTDAQRLTLLLQVAHRFDLADRGDDAANVYRLARSVAILGGNLSSMERSQALLQAANGLLEIDRDAALDTAVQVQRIVEQAPDMLPAQRSQLLEQLRTIALALEDDALTQRIGELARNPYIQPSGILPPALWPLPKEALSDDAQVVVAAEQRRVAARQLADRLAFTGGADTVPEQQALAIALAAEDTARGEYFRRMMAAGLPLSQQATLMHDRREWMAMRARAAVGGFGISVSPEWSANPQFALQDLGTATANFNPLLDALGAATTDPAQQAALRYAGLRWLALQYELGLYPNASVADLADRLRFAQADVERFLGRLALPLDYDLNASPSGFRIQSAQ